MNVVLFDKLGRREEYTYAGSDNDRIVIERDFNGDMYMVTYDFQFLDKRNRPVYTEIRREILRRD